jgi:signal transduction histidine kinase
VTDAPHDVSPDPPAYPLGLAGRLAVFTAVLAVVLVLGATEVALRWSERSRLEDARREALTVGTTLASYLTRVAPTGQRDSLLDAFTHWARNDISGTNATVYLAQHGRLVTVTAVDSSLLVEADPLDSAAFAARSERTAFVAVPEPTWRIALPLGRGRPFGLLDVRVSTQRLADWARAERRRGYALAITSALLVAAGVAWLVSRWVGRPLAELGRVITATRKGEGWGPEAPLIGPSEFRALARRYNALRAALITREQESEARGALLAIEERARTVDRLAAMAETSASVAHEVGTPLNTIRGHLQLLRSDLVQTPGAKPERVGLVLEQVDRVITIVRQSLDRYEWPAPTVETVDLTALVERTLRFLDPSFTAAGVAARVEHDAEHPEPVLAACDPGMVEQILLNLTKNAIEATRAGGHVTLAVARTGGRAEIRVRDDGPGLSAEARAQLFNPFATTKGPDGTGLGLAISRRLARALDGELTLVPTDRGVTWSLTLPLAPRAANEDPA